MATSSSSLDDGGPLGTTRATVQSPAVGELGALHELVSARKLKLSSEYAHRTRTVRPDTFKNLQHVLKTSVETKSDWLKGGQANQLPDVVQTWGESFARTSYARRRAKERPVNASFDEKLRHDVQATVDFESAGCGDTAALEYMRRAAGPTLNAPVMLVGDQDQDHEYVLIGDHRDPRWGRENTVVDDPWKHFPTSYVLAEADNLHPGQIFAQRAPGMPPSIEAQEILGRKNPVSREAVSAMLQRDGNAEIGPDLIDQVLKVSDEDSMFDERVGSVDPSTRYTDGEHEPVTFDTMPRSLLRRQEKSIAAWESFQQRTGYKLDKT